jgi:hypothetical protein
MIISLIFRPVKKETEIEKGMNNCATQTTDDNGWSDVTSVTSEISQGIYIVNSLS